jgi:hypothetical protein
MVKQTVLSSRADASLLRERTHRYFASGRIATGELPFANPASLNRRRFVTIDYQDLQILLSLRRM